MTNTETLFVVLAMAAFVCGFAVVTKARRAFIVPEGYAGLFYRNGKFVEVLRAGRHVRRGRNLTLEAQDLRKTAMLVASQEILTADNVSLKFSLLVTYQVVDPAKAVHETQSWSSDLYNAAQLALRTVISGIAIESLLNQRIAIDAQLMPLVQPVADKIGINSSRSK